MGWLDRFFGPPTKEKFARLVMSTLRKMGDKPQSTFDTADFQISFTLNGRDAGLMNLRNLYIEYCNAASGDRLALLRRSCLHLMQPPEFPKGMLGWPRVSACS